MVELTPYTEYAHVDSGVDAVGIAITMWSLDRIVTGTVTVDGLNGEGDGIVTLLSTTRKQLSVAKDPILTLDDLLIGSPVCISGTYCKLIKCCNEKIQF